MFGRIGPFELILILIIALVIFGPSKLPQIGRALGESIKEFKKGTEGLTDDINSSLNSTPKAEEPASGTQTSAAVPKSGEGEHTKTS